MGAATNGQSLLADAPQIYGHDALCASFAALEQVHDPKSLDET
jgi:hypothetical protein